jgi:hypothetical protein
VAKVLTKVIEPEPIGNQRGFGLDDDQVIRIPPRGDLQDQAGAGSRGPRGLDPRVNDGTRDESSGLCSETVFCPRKIVTYERLHQAPVFRARPNESLKTN